jgi:hypothetical protein
VDKARSRASPSSRINIGPLRESRPGCRREGEDDCLSDEKDAPTVDERLHRGRADADDDLIVEGQGSVRDLEILGDRQQPSRAGAPRRTL